MKLTIVSIITSLALALAGTGCVIAPVGPAPAPVVEVYGEPPVPGVVWVPGVWYWHSGHRAWEWHRGHWR